MFGLDSWIASFSDGATLALVCLVAVVLGLRHATDPDHLAAVSTLIAGHARARDAARPRASGSRWGARPRDDAVRLRPADRALPELPARAGAGGRRDDGRPRDRRAGRLAAPALAPRRLPPHARTTAARPRRQARSRSPPCRRTGSASCTGWAAAPASASCCWPRSTTAAIAVAALGAVRALHRALDGGALDRPRLHARAAGASAASSPRSRRCSGVLSLSFGVWYALGALEVAPYYF